MPRDPGAENLSGHVAAVVLGLRLARDVTPSLWVLIGQDSVSDAERIVADEMDPAELVRMANRLYDVAGHLGVVANHRRRNTVARDGSAEGVRAETGYGTALDSRP